MEFKTKQDIYNFILKNYSILNQQNQTEEQNQPNDIKLDNLDTSELDSEHLNQTLMLTQKEFESIYFNLRNQWTTYYDLQNPQNSINNYENQFILIETNPDLLEHNFNYYSNNKSLSKIYIENLTKQNNLIKQIETNQPLEIIYKFNNSNKFIQINNVFIIGVKLIKIISNTHSYSFDDLLKEKIFIDTFKPANITNSSAIGNVILPDDNKAIGFICWFKEPINLLEDIVSDTDFINSSKIALKQLLDHYKKGFTLNGQYFYSTNKYLFGKDGLLNFNFNPIFKPLLDINKQSKNTTDVNKNLNSSIKTHIKYLNEIFNYWFMIFVKRHINGNLMSENILKEILEYFIGSYINIYLIDEYNLTLKSLHYDKLINILPQNKLLLKTVSNILNQKNTTNIFNIFIKTILEPFVGQSNQTEQSIKQFNESTSDFNKPINVYKIIIDQTQFILNQHQSNPLNKIINNLTINNEYYKTITNLLIHSTSYIYSDWYQKIMDLYLFTCSDTNIPSDIKEHIIVKIYFPLHYHDDKLISITIQLYYLMLNISSNNEIKLNELTLSIDKTIFDINQLLDEMILNDFTFVNNKLKVDDSHISYISYVNFIYNIFIDKYFSNRFLEFNSDKYVDKINEIKNKFILWTELWNFKE